MKVRDKTKNHTVNQKQAKNKTWIRHKKKLGKKKLKMNINKQEPETGKILIAKRLVKKTWRRDRPFSSSQRYIGSVPQPRSRAHARTRLGLTCVKSLWAFLVKFVDSKICTIFKENGWS